MRARKYHFRRGASQPGFFRDRVKDDLLSGKRGRGHDEAVKRDLRRDLNRRLAGIADFHLYPSRSIRNVQIEEGRLSARSRRHCGIVP
jgi:hypothetical protein